MLFYYKKNNLKNLIKFKISKTQIYTLLLMVILSSCIPKKKLLYLQEQKKNEVQDIYVNVRPEKTIQPFDNIYIKVSSIDEKTANIFAEQTAQGSESNINLLSYTISQSGYINFPFVGEIYVKGLTLQDAQKAIEKEVSQYLTNISITVKFVNNSVAVLGEVRSPGEYSFYRDQITVFQAISYLDLTDKSIVSSEFYYIIPNDVLVVKPINAKFRNLSMVNWPIFLTTITTAVTLYLLFAQ
ncbi:MAG: hypothetical protein B6D61_13595 [Bacteroidetes bacterium 4484_249]|nr:MAG: hypothetical protein B6D61_13595 [Bacteroidetes bacterium 4484_249]